MVKDNQDFEAVLNGVQLRLREVRCDLLAAGLKLQDCGRPEVAVALRHYHVAADSVLDLQEIVRELLRDLDPDAPVPTESLSSGLVV